MISFTKVKKSFLGICRPILDNINLSLKRNDFCVLIGANGCGKSTLLKLISGEYEADSGIIKRQGKVAQLGQDLKLSTVGEMTVLENLVLTYIQKPKFRFYSQYKAYFIQELKRFNIGLEHYIDQPLEALSGGQRQLIASVMVMHSGCEILLLDEHTSALDIKMQNFLMDYTAQQVLERQLTTIMITHKMEDAIRYGNRLIMLHQGKIVVDLQGTEKKQLQLKDLISLMEAPQ